MLRVSGCKINLGLSIVGKRDDGFHNIESVFYPVNWNDVIEILPSTHTQLISYGIQIPGNINDNYCLKAYNLLAKQFTLPPLKWVLLKNIPTGAGLGGGSANAANALILLNEYLELKLSSSQLKTYASQIGSDCAFFIDNVPQYATGRGEVLNKFKLSLSDYKIVIVNPGVHINTAEAYRDFAQTGMYSEPGQVIKAIEKPLTDWKEHLKNDFEKVVFKKNPSIEKLKNTLYQQGAIYASMSGSGSSVFGLFHKNYRTDNISRLFSDYHCFISSELM